MTLQNQNPPEVNFEVTRAFFRTLAHDESGLTLQTLDDSGAGRRELTQVIHAKNIESVLPRLKRLNDAGAGIFITVNRTDLHGRSRANIIGVRAFFIDADDVPMPSSWHVTPDLIVHRSAIRWHCYWLANPDTPLESFTPTQKRLAAFYGTDPAVCDLTRVMRVPGFLHRKAEPCELFLEVR